MQSGDKRLPGADLERGDERFRALVAALDAIVWEADAKTFQFTFVSAQAEKILGYPATQWIEERDFWVNHMHPDDRERSVATCSKATRERTAHKFEYRFIAMDGRIVTIEDIVYAVESDKGRPSLLRGLMVDITERKRVQKALEDYGTTQHMLLEQLLHAQEVERRRLSRDIHDGPLQSLGVCLLAIDRSLRRYERGEYELAHQELGFVRDNLAATVGEVRAVLKDLSLDVLNNYGLEVAVNSYIKHFSNATGIKVQFQSSLEGRLPTELELLMYRLLQESLANVRKHAEAQNVAITLHANGQELSLTVSDDGVGFDVKPIIETHEQGHGIGLQSMKERVQAAGGDLEIISAPGEGTTLRFRCPLPSRPDELSPQERAGLSPDGAG